jgi:hypothetical protein
MRIHRESFLFAVAAIAGGCGATSTPSTTPAQVTIAQESAPPPAESSTPNMTSATPTTTATSAPVASGSPVAEGSDGPAPTVEGGPAPTQEGYSGPTGEGSGGGMQPQCRETTAVTRPSPPLCNDALGAADDCRKAFCRELPFVCDQCNAYKRYFKPRVAERAVACVIGQTERQAQDGCQTYRCGDRALKAACLDSTTDAMCVGIARACKVSVDDCRGMLSGMNDAGRQKMAMCAVQGCPYGLWSCVEGI